MTTGEPGTTGSHDADALSTAEVTLATLRDWTERALQTRALTSPHSHAAGYESAARDALAILDSRHLPPGEPVIFGHG